MGYRVIIADDEKKVVELIRRLGDWERLEIEIADVCLNGQEAYDSILLHQPDFVISDIKMPVIGGIELIEKVRQTGLSTIFIFISGYRHFEYARSAVQLNVMDYLLKPIDKKQLNTALENVCKKINELRGQKEKEGKLTAREKLDRTHRQKSFWEKIIDNPCHFNMTKEACENEYEMQFGHSCYQVIFTCTNVSAMLENRDSMFSDKVNTFIGKCFEKYATVFDYFTFRGHIILLNFEEQETENVKNAIAALYCDIRDLREIYGDFRLNFGCSEVHKSFEEIGACFLEAEITEYGRLIFAGSNMIQYSQVKNLKPFPENSVITVQELQEIQECIKFLKTEELGELFHGFYGRAGTYNNGNPGSMKLEIDTLYKKLEECFVKEKKEWFIENFHYAYLEARNFQQMYLNLYKMLERYLIWEEKKLEEKLGKPVGEAIKFIQEHFGEAISFEDVAAAAKVSVSYLTKLFKKEINMNFSEYITQLRLDKSMEFLAQTNLSIKEIAIKVGYPDEKYFSKLFKKTTGIKPTEYRKIYG